jgi:hypothetical protein
MDADNSGIGNLRQSTGALQNSALVTASDATNTAQTPSFQHLKSQSQKFSENRNIFFSFIFIQLAGILLR